jgi:hypothetical protein
LSVGIETSIYFGKVLTRRRGKGLENFCKAVDREKGKILKLMALSPEKSPFSLMAR